MPRINQVFSNSLRRLHFTATGEVLAYVVLGLSIFCAWSILSFDLGDYNNGRSSLTGPLGSWLAYHLLHLWGVGAFLIPFAGAMYGLVLVFGGAVEVSLARGLAFIVLLHYASIMAQTVLPDIGLRPAFFEYGGRVGADLQQKLVRLVGPAGNLVFVHVILFGALKILGLLSVSVLKFKLIRVGDFFKKIFFQIVDFFRKRELSEEDLIKEAIKEELRQSSTFRELIAQGQAMSIRSIATKLKKSPEGAKEKDRFKKNAVSSLEELADDVESEAVAAIENIDFYYSGPSHGKPAAAMFTKSSAPKNREKEFAAVAAKLMAQLNQFGVEGKITKISEGPVVTTFEYEPTPGTKVSKITGLAQDLARMLQAKSLRILAPIPGKKVLGFEVPNEERRMIGFQEIVGHANLKSGKIALPVAMGVDAFGKVVIEDMAKMPHLLVAGSTGSGKSVFMNTLIGGLIARHSAKDLRFVMIDPKMVELAAYNDLPHMATPVITDPAGQAKGILDALVREMDQRFTFMSEVGARNIEGFNEVVRKSKKSAHSRFSGKWQQMPYIVLIIDELADMMMVLGKDAEIPITRLAQKARAAGIHLVIATQRPSADVVTGLIKANFPTRIGFRVLSGLDSRTILDSSGAEGLLGQGDMLFLNAQGLTRMHGAYLSDDEVRKMVQACKA